MTTVEVQKAETYDEEVEVIVQGFEYELCSNCDGGDLGDHVIAADMFGHAHAWCQRECEPGDAAPGAEDDADDTDGW